MQPWDLRPARDLGLTPLESFRSLQRESGLISTASHLAWWTMIRGSLTVWNRLTIQGQEHIPLKPPFVLVANHTSHLDALVLAAPLLWRLRDRIFPIAAGDVFFHNPLVSAFSASMLNALPMWRKKCGPHALDHLRKRLIEEPCAYILFPEGARSRDGNMLPFKPGLGMLVAGTNVPIVPCHLDGCFKALPPGQRWPRRHRITIRVGKPLSFESVPNVRAGWADIASQLRSRINALAPGD